MKKRRILALLLSAALLLTQTVTVSAQSPDEAQADEILTDQVWADEYAFYPGTALFTTPRAFISAKGITGFTFCPDETMMDLSEVTIER